MPEPAHAESQPLPADLRASAICPACMTDTLDWSDSGALCRRCGTAYPVSRGAWCAIVPDASWRSVLQDTVSLLVDFTINRDAARARTTLDPQKEFESYEAAGHAERDDYFARAWRALAPPPGARVLEVGAGDLRVASSLAEQGYRVVAVEPVPEFLARCEDPRVGRVCGSASRLPFASGSFDVVMACAAVHHFDDPASLLREMGRVTRTGGLLLLIGEPYSAPLSDPARFHAHFRDFSFDIGANEHTPRFADYLHGLRGAGAGGFAAYSETADLRLPHRVARVPGLARAILGRDPGRDPAGGRVTTGARMSIRHHATHGRVSIRATRGPRVIAPPAPVAPEDFPFSPSDYLFRRDRASLVRMWRSLLRAEDAPRRIVVGENDLWEMRRGFSPRVSEPTPDGSPDVAPAPFKWLLHQGACFLRVETGDTEFAVRVRRRSDSSEGSLRVFQNDTPIGEARVEALSDSRWTELRFPLAKREERDSTEGSRGLAGVAEFRLVCDALTELDGMAIGVAIRSVETRR